MRQWRMKSNCSMPISCNLISFADCLLLPIQRHPLLGGPPEYVEEQRQLVFRVYPAHIRRSSLSDPSSRTFPFMPISGLNVHRYCFSYCPLYSWRGMAVLHSWTDAPILFISCSSCESATSFPCVALPVYGLCARFPLKSRAEWITTCRHHSCLSRDAAPRCELCT